VLKWERKLHQGNRFTDVDATPVAEGEVLYVPSYDGALYALKVRGGDILWRFDAGGSKSITIKDAVVYLPSSDGWVYALQKASGHEIWKFELDRGVPTSLVVTEQRIYFASSHQYLYAIHRESGKGLYRLNVGHGTGFLGGPLYDVESQRLYLLSQGGNLMAFQAQKAADKKDSVNPPIRSQ